MPFIRLQGAWWPKLVGPGLLCVARFAHADELIYFKNGFTLSAQSHTLQGTTIEAQVGTGTLVFPLGEVATIEVLPQVKVTGPPMLQPFVKVTPEQILSEAAIAEGIDVAFVRSVAIVESGLVQERVSNKGAVGLMQLMPSTAKELGVDATQSRQNARGGAQYLRTLLLLYRGDSALALAAYNAGPGAVHKFGGVPPYRETRQYVLSVIKEYNRQLRLRQSESKQAADTKKSSKPSATD